MSPRPPAPDYGIIFNNDGGYLKHAEFPMSVEDLLERYGYDHPAGGGAARGSP